jgi:hypothetical protein
MELPAYWSPKTTLDCWAASQSARIYGAFKIDESSKNAVLLHHPKETKEEIVGSDKSRR